VHSVPVKGNVTANNAETLFELALLGIGVIRLSDLIVGSAIRRGGLVPVLLDFHQPEPLPVHAVFAPSRRRPPKVDALVQYLVDKFAEVPWRLPHPVGRRPRAYGRAKSGMRKRLR
jgi:DNA-binding transcriptional LysR family regulator